MQGDDAAAVQAALDCLYMPFADANSCERKPEVLGTQLPGVMLLAHKYKMHTLLADVRSALTAQFEQASAKHPDQGQRLSLPDDLEFVVNVAAAADTCQQRLLLHYCERYLTTNFGIHRLGNVLACKLPASSLKRCQALACRGTAKVTKCSTVCST